MGPADQLQPGRPVTGLARRAERLPAHLRDAAALQSDRRLPATRPGQGTGGERRRQVLHRAPAGRHQVLRRQGPDRRRRGLLLRDRQGRLVVLLQRLGIPGIGDGDRRSYGRVHRQGEALQPAVGEERHRRRDDLAQARLGALREGQDPGQAGKSEAGRQWAVHPRQV